MGDEMECGCQDDGYCDYDGYTEFADTREVKARKDHKCCECRRAILKGEVYIYDVGKYDGDFYSYKTCKQCAEIRRDYGCCAPFGELRSEIWQYLGVDIKTGDIDE